MPKQNRGPYILAAGAAAQLLTGIPAAWGVFQQPVMQGYGFSRGQAMLGFAVLVASNNSLERLKPLTERLRIGAVPRAGKPLPFGLKKAAKALGFAPKACAMIGDQILTDVLAGNLAGMHTVLLQPIDTSREFTGTRINRALERVIKKLWKIA